MLKSSTVFAVLLFISSTPAMAEDTLKTHLDAFRQSQGIVLLEIEQAQKNSSAISASIAEGNRLSTLAAKHSKDAVKAEAFSRKSNAIVDEIMNKYGQAILAANFIYDFDIDKANKRQLEEVLAKTRGAYQTSMDCFKDGSPSTGKVCQKFSNACDTYGYRDGKMYTLVLTEELEKSEIDVTQEDPAIKENPVYEAFIKGIYQFCRVRGIGTPYEAKKPRRNNAFIIPNYYGETILPYDVTFKQQCLEAAPTEERQQKFRQLSAEYPAALSDAIDRYRSWKQNCRTAASLLCSNTYVVKDQVILSYATLGCEVREVTKEDVERDMEVFSTNAEKLNHSTLLDDIQACQEAHNAGFSWLYVKPTLAKTCTERKYGPKKKKKK